MLAVPAPAVDEQISLQPDVRQHHGVLLKIVMMHNSVRVEVPVEVTQLLLVINFVPHA